MSHLHHYHSCTPCRQLLMSTGSKLCPSNSKLREGSVMPPPTMLAATHAPDACAAPPLPAPAALSAGCTSLLLPPHTATPPSMLPSPPLLLLWPSARRTCSASSCCSRCCAARHTASPAGVSVCCCAMLSHTSWHRVGQNSGTPRLADSGTQGRCAPCGCDPAGEQQHMHDNSSMSAGARQKSHWLAPFVCTYCF